MLRLTTTPAVPPPAAGRPYKPAHSSGAPGNAGKCPHTPTPPRSPPSLASRGRAGLCFATAPHRARPRPVCLSTTRRACGVYSLMPSKPGRAAASPPHLRSLRPNPMLAGHPQHYCQGPDIARWMATAERASTTTIAIACMALGSSDLHSGRYSSELCWLATP